MKQINLTMDGNGHIPVEQNGGVAGDHHAALLTVTLSETMEQVDYYRLFFAGDGGTKMTEQLYAVDGKVVYSLPREVTALGHTVLCQLCGYAVDDSTLTQLFKSDAVPLSFGTSLPDTADLTDSLLTDRLTQMLEQVETIADQFDLQMGTVTTLDYNSSATAHLVRSGEATFTLNLGIPKGEKGEGSFTAGDGIAIENGIISTKGRPRVYEGLVNTYEYTGIDESKSLSELADSILFINPRYTNSTQKASFYTAGEGIYATFNRYEGNTLVNTIPVGSIVPGRLMAVYITADGIPVYLNPYEPPENPLPIYTITPGDVSESFPMLSLSTDDYSPFAGGKTVLAITTGEIPFNSTVWYGPYMSTLKVFNGSAWVGTNTIAGKTIPAGQPLWLYLDYDSDNYSFRDFRLLNPPT